MSYNGSGTFQINSSGQPVITGTVISSTAFNALTSDLATGLSTAITKDGQTTTTSRILFAQGISSTLVTDATSTTTGSIITAGGISTQKALWVGTTSQLVGAAAFNSTITMDNNTALKMKASNGTPRTFALYDASAEWQFGDVAANSGFHFSNSTAGASWLNFSYNGLVGIGMTPSNVLDITQSANAASKISLLNATSGTAGRSQISLAAGTATFDIYNFSQGYTTSALAVASGSWLRAGGQMSLSTDGASPIVFSTNGTEAARFDSSGNLVVGTTSAAARIHGQSSGLVMYMRMTGVTGDSFQLAQFAGDGGSDPHQFFAANTGGSANAAAALYKLGKASTSRSINAAGTINASGADYAEYMTKADACGAVAKGEIIGVNIDGKLTDKFANSHSFVIKSTDPSYVGGDTWGVALDGSELEAARQKVDRIAFSGQVPVNVTGATVGDYIVPVAGPDGGIAGEAVTNPTFDQYRAAVGRVWKILEDGRAFVSVKVS